MKRSTTVLRTKSNASRARSVVQSVRLSKLERTALRKAAAGQGVSVSDYVRALLRQAGTFAAFLLLACGDGFSVAERVKDDAAVLGGDAGSRVAAAGGGGGHRESTLGDESPSGALAPSSDASGAGGIRDVSAVGSGGASSTGGTGGTSTGGTTATGGALIRDAGADVGETAAGPHWIHDAGTMPACSPSSCAYVDCTMSPWMAHCCTTVGTCGCSLGTAICYEKGAPR
jgi:hypothetical protein